MPHARVALARRLFAAGVLTLVLNDWVLKGSGLLPAWLTGKLSDIAGLTIAPVVLAALLTLARVPERVARLVAVASIGAAFAALKLDARAAAAYDGAVNATTRALSLPFVARTARDPSDLLALPLLGAGIWLSRRLSRDRGVLRSGALGLGLLACAATSPAYYLYDAHWGFQDARLDRMWAARLEHGAVVVQFGRQSNEGTFELGLELAAVDGVLSLDPKDVRVTLPNERVDAELPESPPAPLVVRPGETVRASYVFRPRGVTWPKGAPGSLDLSLMDGARRSSLRVALSFDERRLVDWSGAHLR